MVVPSGQPAGIHHAPRLQSERNPLVLLRLGQEVNPRHRGNGGQSFASKAQRFDGGQILLGAQLTGGMAQKRRLYILGGNAAAVVCHPQIGHTTILDLHRHLLCTGIHGVFHQLFGSRGRTLHHLTGGDEIRHMALKL